MTIPTCEQFVECVEQARREWPDGKTLVVPVGMGLLADQLTPVLCYRRLVAADERSAPSFLLESVEGGNQQGRYSILGAQPAVEVIAHQHEVVVVDHRAGTRQQMRVEDPLEVPSRISASLRFVNPGEQLGEGVLGIEFPDAMLGGWVGYASYDTVRYAEPVGLSFDGSPEDDRGLPDTHFGLYDMVVVFDHVSKLVFVVRCVRVRAGDDAQDLYERAIEALEMQVEQIQRHAKPLASGWFDPAAPVGESSSNITREQHGEMVDRAKQYIAAGDVFQVVLGQRFERKSTIDPFDVYRALRVVNPSPYMVYLQAQGCLLVASSPEILCRVRRRGDELVVTNRPLAGTRKRGRTEAQDRELEAELLADHKERAEHVMLVDLGRNDVGRVSVPGSVQLPAVMEIERYSHVMHISSTVTGVLRPGFGAFDALRAALPVGTISGAPKVRAMQIIDELEPIRRGPYGGGVGYVGLDGQMDIALTLRTMVVPVDRHDAEGGTWVYHIQAAGGIVVDSDADAEYQETVNKAAALMRAIDVAEAAFLRGSDGASAS